MATLKQEKAVDNLVENGGNVSKAMRDAKYSPKTAKNPKKLTESKGFAELCKKYGLTEKLLLESLVEDIKTKPRNRKSELELGFKVKGLLTEKHDIMSGGEKITPIFNGKSLPKYNSNREDIQSDKKD